MAYVESNVPFDPVFEDMAAHAKSCLSWAKTMESLATTGALIVIYSIPYPFGSLHVTDNAMDEWYQHKEACKC